MTLTRAWIAGLVLMLGAGAAAPAAEVVSPAPDGVRLTLYRGDTLPPLVRALNGGRGLALVTETRTLDLPAGPSRLVFQGVADTLVPQSVQLQGLPGPVRESDFDYDLLSPGALVAKSIGSHVQRVRTDPKTGHSQAEDGVLRSGPEGVVLQTAQGVEALRCSGLPEKLVFDRVPQGLAARPTLSVQATSPRAGRYRVSLSYLATGFDWSASYVASLAPDGRSLALSGWLTLQNGTATGFVGAPTDVVAGRLARTGDDAPVQPSTRLLEAACWRSEPWWKLMQDQMPPPLAPHMAPPPPMMVMRMAKSMALAAPSPPPKARASDLGDYKLYTLPEPTTVAARQTKQVRFLDQRAVAFERLYVYETPPPEAKSPLDPRTRVTLALRNTPGDGLGEPLPSGRAAVMAPASGAQVFAGGGHLDDTPVGLPFELPLGLASQVQARTSAAAVPDGGSRPGGQPPPRPHAWAIRVELTNAGDQPVTVELRQPGADAIRLTSEDRPHRLDRGRISWRIALAAHASTQLRYAYSER